MLFPTELSGPGIMEILFLVFVIRCFFNVIKKSFGIAEELIKNMDFKVSG